MHIFISIFMMLMGLVSCGGTSALVAHNVTTSTNAGAALARDGKLYNMAQIFQIMEDSFISYTIATTNEEVSIELGAARTDTTLDPFLALQELNGSSFALTHAGPPGTISALFELAAEHMVAGNMAAAIPLYEQAVKQEPSYFKAHTHVGHLYLLDKDYQRAEHHLLRAVELNPIDYQAYFFLAHTYHHTHRPKEALRAITAAFLLNRNNPRILDLLDVILAGNGLRLRRDRLVIPARIDKKSETKIDVTFSGEEAWVWMPLVVCMTAWLHEPAFRLRWEGQNENERDQYMYRECLVNQVAFFDEWMRQGAKLSESAKYLHGAVLDGYLSIIIIWELMAPRAPTVIPLLPVELRDALATYIQKYVYVAR